MRLKRLELSGFKSFAKTTVLEFPSRVTAIVGPNGSGKSNIKEAIQWVLGEQSMKSLRGKKGEDMIWNGSVALTVSGEHSRTTSGSSGVPRMGKASVALIFDNADKRIPVEFDEVAIARKIFRDGANEYSLNNSPVRLRDVAELMAHIGLGESRHNIIGQGEVDRVLLSSPRDRYRMLEEALGLRVYHLKKNEAERKMEATARNIEQVEALRREIAPHLKFLRASARKAGERAGLEAELSDLERTYCGREEWEIASEKTRLAGQYRSLAEKESKIRGEIARLTLRTSEAEAAMAAPAASGDADSPDAEKQLAILQEDRREAERELGRLEGKLEAEKEKNEASYPRAIDTGYVRREIQKILAAARLTVQEEDRLDVMRSRLAAFCGDLERLSGEIKEGRVRSGGYRETGTGVAHELEAVLRAAQSAQAELGVRIQKHAEARERRLNAMREKYARIRETGAELQRKQDEARDLALARQKISFEDERIRAREDLLIHFLASAGMSGSDAASAAAEAASEPGIPQPELLKKIERLRIRLEEVGAIDPSVVKEYENTDARHKFLESQLEDLRAASSSLANLIQELENRMKKDFREGFAGIKDAFGEYFRLIFGGGKAVLRIANYESGIRDEDGVVSVPDEEKEEGVEIEVSLPRKRITGLAMLSGGERALASIALLFAISAVNPPPFLILDETDAALDEANSERFGALLKELSKKTQLIVITHNRETMKSAGVLYGVTMGHDGVSRLLSLKLEQAEAYTNR
ncbi:MAG: AAA family ATPase [Patescibacteria group bacterium]